jgi:hypothetical protein
MDRATALRNTVRGVAPFLYVAGFILVMMGDVAAVSFVERAVGFYERDGGSANFTTLRYNGDVIVAVATLIIGGAVFGLLALMLERLERLHRPAIRDHMRHCTALYVILGTLVVLLLVTYENQAAHGVSLGYGVAVVALFVVGYAIVIDALVLWRQRRRYVQVSSGNIT